MAGAGNKRSFPLSHLSTPGGVGKMVVARHIVSEVNLTELRGDADRRNYCLLSAIKGMQLR